MFNKQISDMFLRIADALEIKGENVFKIRAYRTAGQNIMGLSRQLLELFEEDPGEIDNIEGIGKDLKEKIIELLMTGGLKYYEDLRAEFPEGFLDMLKLSGLGPKKLKKLHERLGIENVDDLEKSCRRGDLENLEGMGVKTQEKFIEAIGYFREQVGRMLLPEADKCADEVLKYLLRSKYFKKIEKAGSLRRGKETIGDLDVLAQAGDREKAMDFFVKYPEVREVVAKGHTKSSVILKNGTQIDLRIVESKSFGAALVYFTGSKEHNVKIRSIAKRKGYKLNEYGVFFESGGKEKYIAGKTEKDVYAAIDLEWIPPELRENRG
ncbi:MAG: DNA polymerase III, partial [Candidatus Omnitrophica bacterium]|nr:DNA polymerase III [Candidatus Omnitrophota bacterium]